MDLTKYYPDIVAKYPAYVTKRELCEICHICPKTAYNLEQQGEIPYTIEQNHLIRSHKIKLTDILAYLYRRECRQEADSPYICAMRKAIRRGDLFYADLNPVVGSEQGGIRPVLVIQNDVGNHFSPTVVAAAITSRKAKNSLPTHILLENVPGLAPTSLLLLEQLRTIDRKRLRGYIGRISKEKMLEVDAALAISIGIGYPNERRTHNV